MTGVLSLSDQEFQLISGLVRQRFGISLGDQKRTLIVERLQKVLRLGGFSSFKDYYRHVVQDPSGRALLTLVDKISTNHTYFFREREHFDFFKAEALPRVLKTMQSKGRRDIRVWSAGCSSGEEAYTLAMILAECAGRSYSDLDIGILATDISVSVLEKAVAGGYADGQMSQLPPGYRQKYFSPLRDGGWMVRQSLKEMVIFRRLNLMRSEYPFRGRFHAIFCRNVMIYFDSQTRQDLVDRFHRYLEPGGYLFIGHSETINRSTGLYQYVKPAVYQKI